MTRATAILMTLGLGAAAGRAQLIVGNDDFTGGTNAWHIDLGSNQASPLWGGGSPEVWGMAAAPDGTLYVSSGVGFWSGQFPAAPARIGDFTVDGVAVSFVGLAWDSLNGRLYGSRNTSTAGAPEGVYQIDPATGAATLALAAAPAIDYDLGGLDFNPDDGFLYATDDAAGGGGTGLFRVDLTGGSLTRVAAYPAGETDIDGLAIGDGRAYLIEDEPGNSIHVYDFVAGTYLADIPNPMPDAQTFAGGAYLPEPGTCCLFLVALGWSARRRRALTG